MACTVALRWMMFLAMCSCDEGASTSPSASFERLLTGSDDELFWGVVTRIEDREWEQSKLLTLPPEQQVVIRVAWFRSIFGNGGLQYWFEKDGDLFGLLMVDALGVIGLERSASALRQAYAVFSSPADWKDWNRRMVTIRQHASAIEASEAILWTEFKALEGAGGRYIRSQLSAFDILRSRRPYDSVSKSYDK